MLANHWFKYWRDSIGFPDDYLVVDLETSGFVPAKNKIVQIAYCLVKGRRIETESAAVIDWTRHPGVDHRGLADDLQAVGEAIAAKDGCVYPFSYEYLRDHGEEPSAVLKRYYAVLANAKFAGMPIVGHNCVSFDRKFLQYAFNVELSLPYLLSGNDMLDTGLMEKASQLTGVESMPRPGEASMAWADRVARIRAPGVNWNLGRHCISKYKLDETDGVDRSKTHDAGYDCYVTHRLFERYRAMGEEANGG